MRPTEDIVKDFTKRLSGKKTPYQARPIPRDLLDKISQFPHCDSRILHGPGECQHCDKHKEWQALRLAWGISFTGWQPEGKELPCPADYARGESHTLWPGNTAKPKE